jgi:hypothetical protein
LKRGFGPGSRKPDRQVRESYPFRLATTDGTASGHKGCKKPKGIPINESELRDVEAAAIGQQVLVFEAATGRGIAEALESLAREKVDALFVTGGGFFGTRRVQLAVSWTVTSHLAK